MSVRVCLSRITAVGFRIVTRRPEALDWLIIQNANAYEIGFTDAWEVCEMLCGRAVRRRLSRELWGCWSSRL